MARWEPDAAGRLVEAAMQLYRERGFDRTTVADIAARAGLTERTFFRYFADKREVLFSGSRTLQDFLVDQVASAPSWLPPIDVVARALAETASFFEQRRDFARQRHALIVAHAELQERELIKLAALATAIGGALRRRGVPASAASLAAEAGMTIFKRAFEAWVEDGKKRDLGFHVRAAHLELEGVIAGARRARAGRRHGPSGPGAGSHNRLTVGPWFARSLACVCSSLARRGRTSSIPRIPATIVSKPVPRGWSAPAPSVTARPRELTRGAASCNGAAAPPTPTARARPAACAPPTGSASAPRRRNCERVRGAAIGGT